MLGLNGGFMGRLRERLLTSDFEDGVYFKYERDKEVGDDVNNGTI